MGDEAKLFVGGLSFDTTEEGLEDAFAKYGKIVKADVILDRETHRPRGFGFVTFENPDDAENAQSGMHGKVLDGREIRVDKAGKSGSRSGGGGGYRGGGFRGGRGGRGGCGYSQGGYGSSDRSYEDRYSGDRGERNYGGYNQRSSREYSSGGGGYSSGGGGYSSSGGGGGGSGGGSGGSSGGGSGGGYRDRSQNYDRSYSREGYDSYASNE